MNILLKKEAWSRMSCSGRLAAPNMRRPKVTTPQRGGFVGFRVPTNPKKPQMKTNTYYFGDTSVMPADNYKGVKGYYGSGARDFNRRVAIQQGKLPQEPLLTQDEINSNKPIDWNSKLR